MHSTIEISLLREGESAFDTKYFCGKSICIGEGLLVRELMTPDRGIGSTSSVQARLMTLGAS